MYVSIKNPLPPRKDVTSLLRDPKLG